MAEQRPERPPQRKGARPIANNGGMKFGRGLVGWVLFVALAIMLFMLLRNQGRTFTTIPFNEFNARLAPDRAVASGAGPAVEKQGSQPDRIEWLRLEGDDLYGKFVRAEDIPEK